MFTAIKQQWCDLKKGRPGHRFQDRYDRNKQNRADESFLRRWFQPILGVLLFAAGIFFCIFPGPGLPLVLIGAMLLSERSLAIARAMDWTELKARHLLVKAKRWWRRRTASPGRRPKPI